MYPFLFQVGAFRLPAYGVIALLALLATLVVIRHFARLEGRDPSKTTDAIVLTVAVAYVGARVMEVAINGRRIFASPDALMLLLSSTGVFYGGLISAVAFGAWWFRRIRLPALQGLDLMAPVGAVVDGVGRWGCFFSGCCWGTPTDLPWAVTFPEVARRLHAGLPAVPLHPTQIYFSLVSLAILGVLALAYRRKRFHGQIITIYLVLYSVTRFFLEFVRGDADRGFVLGGLLSTSQLIAIFLAIAGIAAYVLLDRRHRLTHEPDWRPAPMARSVAPLGPGRRRPAGARR